MGSKRYDETYTGSFKTREEYLEHLDKLSVRYHNDDEFRESMKKRSKERYDLIMSNNYLHQKECERRREYFRNYMRDYNRRKRQEKKLVAVVSECATAKNS